MDSSTAPAASAVELSPGQWTIDPRNSTASFAVRNFGVNTVSGVVPIRNATVVVAEGQEVASLRATLNLAGIDTANSKRDNDLRGQRLLHTEKFPDLAFDATETQRRGEGWRVTGTLSAHGASIPVTLDAELITVATNGELTIRATTRFDRRDLGIRAPRLLIGREVLVDITAKFRAG